MTTLPVVSLICVSDRPKHLRTFLAALAAQTRKDWEAIVLDQSVDSGVRREVYEFESVYGDVWTRYERVPRRGDWGQTEKMQAVAKARGRYVGFPNDDAYYCPAYLEHMLNALALGLDLVYCDWISASDRGMAMYAPVAVRPLTGHIDVGGFLVDRQIMLAHGWPDRGPVGDGALIESLVKSGVRHGRVPRTLYVKN